MLRIFFFILVLILPVIFGWWVFIPLAILFVYLVVLPYEIIFAGIILDSLYYLGDGLLYRYPMTIFSLILIFVSFGVSRRIHWKKLV